MKRCFEVMTNKEADLPCYLHKPNGHHDPGKATKGHHQAPQRIEIVIVVEAKEGVEDEVVVMNPMHNKMTIKRIKEK